MTEPPTIDLARVRELVRDPVELAKGSQLFDEGGLLHLARWERKLFAEAPGAASSPYKVSLTFDAEGAAQARCSCMAARSRPFCKHAVALLVAWAHTPRAFAAGDAPPPGAAGEGKRRKTVKKGAVEAEELRRQGVQRVLTLVRELALAGVRALDDERLQQVRALGESLREHQLRRLSARTLDLVALLEREGPLGALAYLELLADLLLTARKLEKHLREGEPLEERHVEELLGKTWRKRELPREEGLELLEYAHAAWRTSDDFVVRESRFLELGSGRHLSEKQIVPGFLAKRTAPKPSWVGSVLAGAAAVVYPGYPPSRIALEGSPAPRPLEPEALQRLLQRAQPDLEAALVAFREQQRDPFAPARAPVCVRAELLALVDGRLHLVDAAGLALPLGDQEAPGEVLGGARLRAVLGELELVRTRLLLHPLALIVEETGARPELRPLAGRAPSELAAGEPGGWLAAARAEGASAVAIALQEVREELAEVVASGLAGLTPRVTAPLQARLAELGLTRPAALLEEAQAAPDPADRLDPVVKLWQVLGLALARLAEGSRLELAGWEPVPGRPGVRVPRPERALGPGEAGAAVARGELHPFLEALHLERHFAAVAPAEAARELAGWGQGAAREPLAAAVARDPEAALQAARRALLEPWGASAELAAVCVLGRLAADSSEAARMLEEMRSGGPRAELVGGLLRKHGRDGGSWRDGGTIGVRAWAREARRRLEAGRGQDVQAERQAALRRLAEAAELALSGPRPEARLSGVGVLIGECDLAALPLLRRVLREDPAREVRADAAWGLALLGDAEVVPRLLARLRERAADPEEARIAVHALGLAGDARGVPLLLEALAEGWRGADCAQALARCGLLALEPLLDRVEGQPELAGRAGVQKLVEALPADPLEAAILERLGRRGDPAAALARASALLKLVAKRKSSARVVAEAVLRLVPTPGTSEERALRRAAEKLVGGGG